MDELRHGAHSFGRVCLSQYHQTGSKQVDVWSVRDFFALPVLPQIIKHYIQLSINTKCSQSTSTNGLSNPKSVARHESLSLTEVDRFNFE